MGEFEKRLREELFGFKPESLNNDKSTLETVIDEARKEFPSLEAISRCMKLIDDFKGDAFALAVVKGLLRGLWLTEEKWFGNE